MKTWQKYAAEAYGTFVLVGIGTGAILGANFLNGLGVASGLGQSESFIITVAFAFGLALMIGLYTVGRVSGGHFNPAISLAAFLDKRIGIGDMVGYWVAQVAGALIASGAFAWILSRDDVADTYTLLNRAAVDEFGAFIAEAVFTLVFVFAILVLSQSRAHTKFMAMGFTLAAIHLIGIPFTGASVNPARTFAPALVGGQWEGFWAYLAGPALGAVAGWALYKVITQGDPSLTDDVEDAVS